jgi:hypothetical protein
MRACFLGQNVCALGYGVTVLQTPPITTETEDEKSAVPKDVADEESLSAESQPSEWPH